MVSRRVLMMVGFAAVSACGGTTAPSQVSHVAPTQITVSDLSPNIGSSAGGARVGVTGTGFMAGIRVIINGNTVPGVFGTQDGWTHFSFESPAHPAGAVDLVITNLDGGTVTVPNGYTFVPPDALDFNGSWWGYGNDGQDRAITFTIENNTIRSVVCDLAVTLTFPAPLPIINGEFSFVRDDGASVRGRIASADYAVGTINLAPCNDTVWTAGRVHQ